MKIKKILAVISAFMMSVSVCASVVPANAASGWKTAYQNKLSSLSSSLSDYRYCLYDVDSDGIPEMFLAGELSPVMMYTYQDGTAKQVLSGKLSTAIAQKMTYLYNKNSYLADASYNIYFGNSEIVLKDYSGDVEDHFMLFYGYENGVLTPKSYYEGDFSEDSSSASKLYFHDGDSVTKISETEYTQISSKLYSSYSTVESSNNYKLTNFTPFNAFPDEVSTELTEADLKAKAAVHGTVKFFEYHDYDGNGEKEAFAVISEKDSDYDVIKHVYFIDAKGNETAMPENFNNMFIESETTYAECSDQHSFLGFDIGAGGSGWQSLLYGVKDNIPYELNLSRKIQGFYKNANGDGFYTTVDKFTDDGHLYIDTPLTYSDGQFYIAAAADEPTNPTEASSSGSKGDINNDGEINAKDAALILVYAAEVGAGNFSGTIEEYVNSH